MMLKYLFVFVFSTSLVLANPKDEAQKLLARYSAESDTIKRLELFSKAFLGLPYDSAGPLGEGPQGRYDQDPLYRFETFDCTTFVETVISLSLSRDVHEFEMQMNEIRYQNGVVDYLSRNHFPSLQWIPYNVTNGLLREINDQVVPIQMQKTAEAVINLPGWLKAIKLQEIKVPLASIQEREFLLEELRSYAQNYSPVVAKLQYIPISLLLAKPEILQKIPQGAIVNFVRPNWDIREFAGTHMNVSHQGIILKGKNSIYLRHASSSGLKAVIDQPLLDYLRNFENHPTLKGIHLMQINH